MVYPLLQFVFFCHRERRDRSGPVWNWQDSHILYRYPTADQCGGERLSGSGPRPHQRTGSAGMEKNGHCDGFHIVKSDIL